MSRNKPQVPMLEKIGYSLGDGSANLVFQMMMMYQLYFYTDVFGIKATSAGMILLFARVFDAFIDPLAGILSDRTKTKWGKYRPWVLWTAIPFAVFYVLAFSTPDLGERGKIIYAGVTYTLLMAVYSFNNTPYASLGGVMTSDIKERTQINSIRFISATIATFVVQGLTLPLVAKFGAGDAAHGWTVTIGIFAVAVMVLLVITSLTSHERITPPEDQKTDLRQDFKDVFNCIPWRTMFVVTLFLFITLALWNSSMNYYFNYFVDKQALYDFVSTLGLTASSGLEPSWGTTLLNAFGLIAKPDNSNVFAVGFSLFNMVGQLVTLIAVIFLSGWLSGMYGKRNVFIVSILITAVLTGLFFMVDSTQVALIFIINTVRCVIYGITIPLLWAMMADVADYSEWMNHRRATGFVFAGVVFGLKAGLGIGGALCGVFVSSFGFVANVVQTDTAILGIRLTSSLIPAITFALCGISLMFYPITKSVNENIQEELRIRRK